LPPDVGREFTGDYSSCLARQGKQLLSHWLAGPYRRNPDQRVAVRRRIRIVTACGKIPPAIRRASPSFCNRI